MAKRDVELVIRAKNEATKAIDSVADALKTLTKVQNDVSASAVKTDGILGKLGQELETLRARAKGLEAFGTIARQFEAAGAAVQRLSGDLERTVQDLTKLKSEAASAAQSTAGLTASAKAAADAYLAQKRGVDSARAAQAAINSEVRKSEATFAALASKIKALTQPNAELRQQYEQQKVALDALKAKQSEIRTNLDQQRSALKAAAVAHRELQVAVKASASNQQSLQSASDKTAASVDRQRAAFAQAQTTLAEIASVANQASVALGGVAANEKAISTASQKAASNLQAVAAAIERQRTLGSPAAVDKGPAASAVASYRAQTAAVEQARQQFEALRSTTTQLGAAMAAATQPSNTLRQQFLLAQQASAEAKAAYIAQAQALNTLRGSAAGGFAAFAQGEARLRSVSAAEAESSGQARTLGEALRQLANAFRGVSTGATESAGRVSIFRAALQATTGETRTALGIIQRLRGQVLSLAAGYLGLVGAIQGIGSVVTTIRTVEAAQNRLGAVFEQDQSKIGAEMRFLTQQADRLGIQFGVLADEYTKFSVAAKAANFSQEATRKVFLSVAEAGRVNKLSLDNLQGVFLALQQMISKGKVSSEELRRQMGDRLPGAFNIFARAIGVSTAELDKMLRAGDLVANESTLIKFAHELDRTFGTQLATSLTSVTTALGRFENSLFHASALVAQGGFAEGLKNALAELNAFFHSRDGEQFFLGVGAALEKFLSALTFLARNIDTVTFAFKVFLGFKIGTFLTSLTTETLRLVPALARVGVALDTTQISAKTFTGAMTAIKATMISFGSTLVGLPLKLAAFRTGTITAASGVGLLRGAMLGLVVVVNTLGAALRAFAPLIIAIAATQIISFFAGWATSIDDTTTALAEHERIVGRVAEAYANAKDKAADWGSTIKGVTLAEAQDNLREIGAHLIEAEKALEGFVAALPRGRALAVAGPEIKEIVDLTRQWQSGAIKAEQFRAKLDDLNKGFQTDNAKKMAGDLSTLVDKFLDLKQKTGEGAIAVQKLGDTSSVVSDIIKKTGVTMDDLVKSTDDVTGAMNDGADATAAYEAALAELTKDIPTPKIEGALKILVDSFKAIQAALATDGLNQFGTALRALATGDTLAFIEALAEIGKGDFSKLGAVFETMGTALSRSLPNTDAILKDTQGSLDAASTLIKHFEGFISTPKFDVNHLRVGFGSDTVTLSDGSVHEVVAGMRVSVEDANRDLNRRVGDIFSQLQSQIGSERFAQLTKEQQAVLASLSFNFGKLPDSVAAAVKTGSTDQVVSAIKKLAPLNNGVNADRRNQEAQVFAGGGQQFDQNALNERLATEKKITEEQVKQAEKGKEFHDNMAQKLADGELSLSQVREENKEGAIAEAVRKAELEAKRAGTNLTQEELNKVRELAAAEFEAKHAKDGSKQVEEQINALKERQAELVRGIELAEKGGNTSRVAELKAQLQQTNTELRTAADNAMKFYQATGGAGADTAILKMQNLGQEIDNVNTKVGQTKTALLNASEVNNQLVEGLSNAFSSIAQSIADVIAKGGSLKDILGAVGQAFLKFAADFLIQIGQMIIKQALLNALSGGGSGGVGGFLSGLFHKGGVVGRGGAKRMASPAWFTNAPRMHAGGVVGLKSNEMPAILKRNEEVLADSDPRNILNGGAALGGGGKHPTTIVNAIDAPSFLSAALGTRAGERVILNWINANKAAVRGAIG